MLFYPFGFFLFPYLTLKLFCFLCIRLLICLFSTGLLAELSFIILFLSVLLDHVLISFESSFLSSIFLSSFINIFWFISSSCPFCLQLFFFFFFTFLFHSVLVYFPFLSLLQFFFICPSSLVFNPSFLLLFGFLRGGGKPILLATIFFLA